MSPAICTFTNREVGADWESEHRGGSGGGASSQGDLAALFSSVENPRAGISRVSLGLFPRSLLVLRESSSSRLPGGAEPGSEA